MFRPIIFSILTFIAGVFFGRLLSLEADRPLTVKTSPTSAYITESKGTEREMTTASHEETKPVQMPNNAQPINTLPHYTDKEKKQRLMQTAVNRAGLVVDMDRRFGELFRTLNLTPENAAKLRQLLASRENIKFLVEVALGNDGLEQDAAMASELTQAEEAKLEGKLKEILGVEGFKQFIDYNSNLYQQDVATEIGIRLRNLRLDLNDQQRSVIVSAHRAVEPHPFQPPRWDSDVGTFDKYFKQQNSVLEKVLATAGNNLTDLQQKEIRRYFDEKLEPLRKLRDLNAVQ